MPALIGPDATVPPVSPRHMIVNADDLGASAGVNRGILEAHRGGIVTSASLMVDRPAAAQAAELAQGHPALSVGLHFEQPDAMDLCGLDACRVELGRQRDRFRGLTGHDPTHLDSHHHVHRHPPLRECFAALADELGVPVREASPIAYIGGFYAQWEWQVTELRYVSVEFLEQILRNEVTTEWTELGCHPGYVSDDFQSVYLSEREEELRTLTDPRLREVLPKLEIELASFEDYRSRAAVRT